MANVNVKTVEGFGLQWHDFDQSGVSSEELRGIFDLYFELFPWSRVNLDSVGADAGCGSGRWAGFMAPRVKRLICVDASPGATAVARKSLGAFPNVEVHTCSLEDMPAEDESLDFAYCLGVLHYVPDPRAAVRALVRKLKPGAPLLVYVYYALDNRPGWFRGLWRMVDLTRRLVSQLPYGGRWAVSGVITLSVYLPLARFCRLLSRLGLNTGWIPLSAYRDRSLYTMKTDCLDRFNNRLEHRFTRAELRRLLSECGLSDVVICDGEPYWRAVGVRARL